MCEDAIYKNIKTGKYYCFRKKDSKNINLASIHQSHQLTTGLVGYERVSKRKELKLKLNKKLKKIKNV